MAYTTYNTTAVSSKTLRDRLAARIENIRADYANWRTYRRTVIELNQLTNRELADLGINRSMIRSIAIEAAYGA